MKYQVLLSRKYAFVLSIAACTSFVHGGDVSARVNARFARDMYASRASVLIIGDSTNSPQGSGVFVPYYEGFIQTLPDEIDLCGFRVSGSTGNTSVNGYADFSSGSTSQMVGGGIFTRSHRSPVGSTGFAPPGYRNDLKVIRDGVLPASGRIGAFGLVNLEGIYKKAAQWGEGATIVIRTPFVVSDDDSMLPSLSMSLLTNHDDSANGRVYLFDESEAVDIVFDHDRDGLQIVDAVFKDPETTRVGVEFSGDLDDDDADESLKTLAWCNHILFDQNRATLDRGFYFDSVSIGGLSARDFVDTLDPAMLSEYFLVAPRAYNFVLIWLGQNVEVDEWSGVLWPNWGERIELLGDMAIQASIDSGSKNTLTPILVTPPLADGEFPSARFGAMSIALEEIADRRGWGHIDAHGLVGDSLTNIDPSFDGPGPHPSQEASIYLTSLIYDHLRCLRAEFTGDDTRDFFDVSKFIAHFIAGEVQADLNGDRNYNFFDISIFLEAFSADCP